MEMLKEDNIRIGFLEEAIRLREECAKVGDWMLGLFEVAYAFGWRLTSVKTLRVGQVNMLNGCIRLYKTKNGMRPIAYMMPETQAALVPLVFGKTANDALFTRPNGNAVDDFRQSWANVTEAAGVPDLLFHDLRRTAVRNMARSGRYTEGEIMQIVGLKTRVIFDRYNIVCEKDLRDARDKWAADLAVSGSSVVVAPKSEQLAAADIASMVKTNRLQGIGNA